MSKSPQEIATLQKRFSEECGLNIPNDQDPIELYRKDRDFGEFYREFLQTRDQMSQLSQFISYTTPQCLQTHATQKRSLQSNTIF